MPQYSYLFEARETGSTRLLQILDRIDAGVQKLVQGYQRYGAATSRVTVNVNNYTKATTTASRISESFTRGLHHAAHVWVLYNKAADYAVKRLNQLGRAFSFVQRKVLEVSQAWEPAVAQIRGLMVEGAEVAIQKAKEIGAGVEGAGHSAVQAAEALVELGRAGFNKGAQAAEALIPVLDFSTASMLSLSKSAKIGSIALKQFASTGMSLREIFETILSAANQATTNVQELSSAFTVAAPAARLLNMDALKLSTTLALMAEKGIVSGKAGRYLNTALIRLTDPPKMARRALDRLNISLKSLDLSNPAQWLERFRVAMAKIPAQTERLALASAIFGKRAVIGLLPLLQGGAQMFTEMEQRIVESRKAMEEIKGEILRGLTVAYRRLKNVIQTTYIALKAFLDVPLKAYYDTLTAVVQKFWARLEQVGKTFNEQATDLESWIAVVKKTGFTGIFQGLVREARPELDRLKKLFEAVWEGIKALGVGLWHGIFTPEVKDKIKAFAREIGVEIAAGIKEGVAEGIQRTEAEIAGLTIESRPEEIAILTKHLDDLLNKKYHIAQQSVISDEDHAKVERINSALVHTAKELEKLKVDWGSLEFGSYYQDQIAKLLEQPAKRRPLISKPGPLPFELSHEWLQNLSETDKTLAEYVQRQRAEMTSLKQLSPEDMRALGRKRYLTALKEAQGPSLIAETKEDLEAWYQAETKILDQQHKLNEATAKQATLWESVKLKVMEMEVAVEKYLIEPVNRFQQAILQIREKYDQVLATISEKKLHLQEVFGLAPSEKIERDRAALMDRQIVTAKKRLNVAQTDEEVARIQTRVAELLEKRAQLAPEGARAGFAREAVRTLGFAEKAQLRAEEKEVQRVELEQEYAKRQIPLLEQMARQAQGAPGYLVEILKQLQQQYMGLGRAAEVQRVQQALSKATIAQAKEEAEQMKLMVGYLKRLVELTERDVDANETTATEIQREPALPAETVVLGEG